MIVVFKEKQDVKVAYFVLGDSNLYPDFTEEDVVSAENVPMRFVDGKFTAFCDTDIVSDQVLYDDEFFKEIEFNYKDLVTKGVGYLISVVTDLKMEKDDFGQACVFVQDGRCFTVNGNYEVREIDGVICYGAYREYVRSLLDECKELSIEERAEKIADTYCTLLRLNVYPYVIMDANTGKGKAVYKGGKEVGIDCCI